MFKNKGFLVALTVFVLLIALLTGCRATDDQMNEETDEEEQVEQEEPTMLEGEGIFVGQIDSQSVEIEIDDQTKVFALAEEARVDQITDGSKVAFSYTDQEGRPLLHSVETLEDPDEQVLDNEGVYTGQSDSRSMEVEVDGQPKIFAMGSDVRVDDLPAGSIIAFTYKENGDKPLMLSLEVLEEPDEEADEDDPEYLELKGEGILEGPIDGQSVEIKRNRVFALGDHDLEDVEDGSKVAFTYTEEEERPVLDFIEVVDEPLAGEYIHGTFTGRADSHSVEIEYHRAYALGPGVSVEDIETGSKITFTYASSPYRPELISVDVQ